MKYCERPFQHVYIMPNGDVRCCSWTTKILGNLLENTLEEIWNSEAAEKVRESIRDGSFRFCKRVGCPRCENNSLAEIDEDSEEGKQKLTPLSQPVEFNCAVDYICNHSCPSCRKSVFVPDEEYIRNMKQIIDRILPFLPEARFVSTDGQGDCFASPYIMDMLERFVPANPDLRITLETNGILFDEEHWNRIRHLSDHHIRCVITANSFQMATYKYLASGHDDLEKLLKNLRFIRGLRESGAINELSVSMIIQDRNFRELPDFAQRCIEEFHVDEVRLNPIYKWFQMTEDEYLEKDIFNPNHPYHEEYLDVLKDERLKSKKIFWWGGGNIHDKKMLPGPKYQSLYQLTMKWLALHQEKPDAFADYCLKNGYRNILIYGFTSLGHRLYKELERLSPAVADRRCLEWNGIRTIKPSEEDLRLYDLIVVTPLNEGKSLCDDFREKTEARVLGIAEWVDLLYSCV